MAQNTTMQASDWLTYSHLTNSPRNRAAVRDFTVAHPETGGGLERYLKEDALQDEVNSLMRTYLVWHRFTGECVGYFSLKAGLVAINEQIMPDNSKVFDTVPGVELANFAIDEQFQQKYQLFGLGKILFRRLIVPFVLKLSKSLGIYLIYIFALPQPRLIETYEKYGFLRLAPQEEKLLHQRLKPNYDESCVFMFQTLEQLLG